MTTTQIQSIIPILKRRYWKWSTRETLNRLIAAGYSEKKAKERIASVLVTHIYNVMHDSKKFDSEKYKRDLAELK